MSEENKRDVKSRATKTSNGSPPSREERLASELRANLKKRKDHMRETRKKS